MKQVVLLLFSVFFATLAFSQNQAKYDALTTEANALYEKKEYLQSAQKYAEAFVAFGNKGYMTDRYNAACSWSLAGKIDSAFAQLLKISKSGGYTDYDHITTDTDLAPLYADPRWKEVLAYVKANKAKEDATLDRPLATRLDQIYEEDQKYRQQIDAIEKQYGWDSPQLKAHFKTIRDKDSLNLIEVKKILDSRGWLGASVVGRKGNSALFLVIQHADLKTQEQYLPGMRDAVKNGNASAGNLALLEDRVALGEGKKQIYGSQIARDASTGAYYVQPLEDPDNVDKRRAEVGLGSLQDYVAFWNITWDVAAYKKQLPALEAKQKK
jgi:hypothetical protein